MALRGIGSDSCADGYEIFCGCVSSLNPDCGDNAAHRALLNEGSKFPAASALP